MINKFMRSISDRKEYREICKNAAENEGDFSNFKNNPQYNAILEHVSPEQGSLYLNYLDKNFPEYVNYLEKFKGNDIYGSPKMSEYHQTGPISPTTLRYIKVLSDLKNLMGDLSGKKIIEIGPGYGGQCFILNQFFSDLDYYLVDMEESLLLSHRYLDNLGVSHRVIKPEEVDLLDEEFDLVISNYAYSEVDKEFQDKYWDKIIRKSKKGYFTLNFVSDIFGINSYRLDEINSTFSVKNPSTLEEVPQTFEKNIILYF